MKHQCPVCESHYEYELDDQFNYPARFPFCSDRCKWIDLGAWLDMDYRVTTGSDPDDPDLLGDDGSDHVVF